jgi:2-polyprenyl-3-methyl-5-hydroxy-6-metoxy-1,4-benzoquinol methylase
MYAPCDLCSAPDPEYLFASERLDGPLVRCRNCGLVYVGARRDDFTFADGAEAERSRALAEQVSALGLVDHEVEDAERPLRIHADQERLQRLLRHTTGKARLLDVGAATGLFVHVAGPAFEQAMGIEPDPITSGQARAAGLDVRTGTLEDIQGEPFDAITLLHVIEHLDSPYASLRRVADLLRPGGAVLIETPTIDNVWFKLAPRRWRQLIPDHYFFFSRTTLERLLRTCGLQPVEHEKVSRVVSARFAADRLRRAGLPGSQAIPPALKQLGLEQRTIRINPGDIMSVVALRAR